MHHLESLRFAQVQAREQQIREQKIRSFHHPSSLRRHQHGRLFEIQKVRVRLEQLRQRHPVRDDLHARPRLDHFRLLEEKKNRADNFQYFDRRENVAEVLRS